MTDELMSGDISDDMFAADETLSDHLKRH